MRFISFCVSVFLATNVTSKTIDVATLSEYEQEVHRLGFCWAILNEVVFKDPWDTKDIAKIGGLLMDNGFREKDTNKIWAKSEADTQTKLVLDELIVVQEMLDKCNEDMKAILAKRYVPNFTYMQSSN